MVLVDHDPVEPHLLSIDLLIDVAMVKVGSANRVVFAVAHCHDA